MSGTGVQRTVILETEYYDYLVSLTHICSGLDNTQTAILDTEMISTHVPYLSSRVLRTRPLWKTSHSDLWRL